MLRLWPALIETVPPDALLITLLAAVLLTAELICRGDGGGAKVRLMAGVKLKVLLVVPLVAVAELLDALLAEPADALVDALALEPAATLMMVV
jgi:hypothetical protein